MRKAAAAVLLAAFLGSAAWADEVKVKGLTYSSVRVVGAKDGRIFFQTGGGNVVEKPLFDVDSVKLDGVLVYNQAEQLLAAQQMAQAAKAFMEADAQTTDPRVKDLARWRAMSAWEKAGMIDQSLTIWLALAKESGTAGTFAARPRTMGQKGSPANAAAIKLLEKELAAIKDNTTLTQAVEGALVDLYDKEGQNAKAVEMANKVAGKAPTPGGAGVAPGTSATPAGPVGAAEPPGAPTAPSGGGAQLKLATLQLQGGKPEEALQTVQATLNTFRDEELAPALLLAGKAQLDLSGKNSDPQQARELLIQAGLNFMRVFALWPSSEQAPEALSLAGDVNARLGNVPAARLAYQRVVTTYGRSPQAAQARTQLEKLQAASTAASSGGAASGGAGQPAP